MPDSAPALNRRPQGAKPDEGEAQFRFWTRSMGASATWCVIRSIGADAVLRHLHGTTWLMASLLYGSGLRLLECCRLRVKELDFGRNEITVREGKGRKDRVTMLPVKLRDPLAAHLECVRMQHQVDLRKGVGSVELPDALKVKYPRAPWEWCWQ